MPFGDSGNILSLTDYLKQRSQLSDDCYDLIEKLLIMDPKKRLTVEEARNHKFLLD